MTVPAFPALSSSSRLLFLTASASLLLLAGCASQPPDVPQIAMASTALSDAERAGAVQNAPEELNEGRTKLNLAEEAREHGNARTSQFLATEALADAKVAMTKSQAKQEQQAVASLNSDLEALRREPVAGPVPSSSATEPAPAGP